MKRAISRFGEIHSSFLLIKHMENKRIDPSTVPPFVLDYKPYPDNFISSSLKGKLLDFYPLLTNDIDKLEKEADIKWDKFYEINQSNFFKDRHWILKEFPELLHPMDNQDQVKNILEVGCGVGNTTFPLCKGTVFLILCLVLINLELSKSGKVFFYSFDFAKTAVELLATHEEYDATKCKPFVCDVVRDSIPNFVPIGSINVVIMIFVLSAISPEHYPAVIEKLYQV